MLLLWFYVSGLAILAGAELNAEIEHASPHGKAPGQKNAAGKQMLAGRRAARHFRRQQQEASPTSPPPPAPDVRGAGRVQPQPSRPTLGAAFVSGVFLARLWRRRPFGGGATRSAS